MLPNETELGLLTGQPVNDVSSAEHAARILLNRGAKQVIVTLGSNGSLIANNALSKHIPSCKVDVVDTTAAGDAFIGGFASMLLRGFEPESAVKYANACGAVATTKFGAQPSLPTKAEVDSFLKETNRGVR
jgi:ribokinase